MTENRISADGTTPADGSYPPISPTGAPWLPVWLVPWVVGLTTAAGLAVTIAAPHTIVFKIATIILALAPAVSAASPGMRKPPPSAP